MGAHARARARSAVYFCGALGLLDKRGLSWVMKTSTVWSFPRPFATHCASRHTILRMHLVIADFRIYFRHLPVSKRGRRRLKQLSAFVSSVIQEASYGHSKTILFAVREFEFLVLLELSFAVNAHSRYDPLLYLFTFENYIVYCQFVRDLLGERMIVIILPSFVGWVKRPEKKS